MSLLVLIHIHSVIRKPDLPMTPLAVDFGHDNQGRFRGALKPAMDVFSETGRYTVRLDGAEGRLVKVRVVNIEEEEDDWTSGMGGGSGGGSGGAGGGGGGRGEGSRRKKGKDKKGRRRK